MLEILIYVVFFFFQSCYKKLNHTQKKMKIIKNKKNFIQNIIVEFFLFCFFVIKKISPKLYIYRLNKKIYFFQILKNKKSFFFRKKNGSSPKKE